MKTVCPTKSYAEPTTAEERRLPCIDRVIAWGADHADSQFHGGGPTNRHNSGRYDDMEEIRVLYPENQEEGWFEFPLEVKETEPLRLIAVLEWSPHSGIYQPSLDGVKLGEPIDLYASESKIDDIQLMDWFDELRCARLAREAKEGLASCTAVAAT